MKNGNIKVLCTSLFIAGSANNTTLLPSFLRLHQQADSKHSVSDYEFIIQNS